MVMRAHSPDKNPNTPEVHARFARLGKINAILRNGEKRERYDVRVD